MNDEQKTNEESKSKWTDEKKEAPKKDWQKVADAKESGSAAKILELEHPDYAKLEAKLTEVETELNKAKNDYIRAHAEMVNTQRRAERDIANAHKYGIEKLATELLPIIDNLERSLETKAPAADELVKNTYTGIELTLKMFLEALGKFSIKPINPLGEIFNPDFHTAMTIQEDPTVMPNTVLKVIQKGYTIKDRLLRPAMVIVSKA